MTQEEIAKELGITRARVGQIEKQAMDKLRAKAKELGIKWERDE